MVDVILCLSLNLFLKFCWGFSFYLLLLNSILILNSLSNFVSVINIKSGSQYSAIAEISTFLWVILFALITTVRQLLPFLGYIKSEESSGVNTEGGLSSPELEMLKAGGGLP